MNGGRQVAFQATPLTMLPYLAIVSMNVNSAELSKRLILAIVTTIIKPSQFNFIGMKTSSPDRLHHEQRRSLTLINYNDIMSLMHYWHMMFLLGRRTLNSRSMPSTIISYKNWPKRVQPKGKLPRSPALTRQHGICAFKSWRLVEV